jgi:hypothetical protein
MMPKYTLEIGGKTYDIESDKPLSDTELMGYAQRIGAPAAPVTPPGQIPGAAPGQVAPPPVEPSTMQRAMQGARQNLAQIVPTIRPTVEALGGAGGAILGTSIGPAGTVGGAGLGYGIAKTGLDVLEQALGTQQAPTTATEALVRGGRDVLTGATFEAGGRVLAPVITKGLEAFGRTATKALDVKGRQATKIAQAAAGKEIDAIRAALRNAQPGETPAQATAGIPRKAWQALNNLGTSTDEMDIILKNQTDDLLADLSRLARGGNETEIRQSIDASRQMLNAITSPMRQTELVAANQAAETIARLGPQATQRQASMIQALRQGQPAPVPAPQQGGLIRGTVTGEPLQGQSMVVPGTEAARLNTLAAQAQGPLRRPDQMIVAGEPIDRSATFLRNRLAASATEQQEAADIFANIARQRRVERDFVQRQIGSLEDYGLRPLNVDSVISVVESAKAAPGRRVSGIQQQVLGKVRDQLQSAAALNNGVIDARDLYTIRKEGVNEIIDGLMAGRDPKVSKKVAADVLSIVRPAIDDAIEKAGGTAWRDYLRTFESGAKDLEKRQLAAEAFRLFKDSPEEYVKLVRGNNPAAVEAVFGTGNFDIFKEMSKEMSTLNKVASYVERQGVIANKVKGGQQELVDLINANSWKRRLPNWFSPSITATNLALKNVESRLNDASLKMIEEATLSSKSMLELLEGMPPKERAKLVRLVNRIKVGTEATRLAAPATMAPEQPELAQ